jgi:head-tail adaptor
MLANRILRPGELDVRLVIQSNTPTLDTTTNEPIDSWSTVTTVGAKRILKGGREGFEAAQEVVTNVETYLIRYSTDVSGMDGTYRVYESGTTDHYYVGLVEVQRREGWIMFKAEKKA